MLDDKIALLFFTIGLCKRFNKIKFEWGTEGKTKIIQINYQQAM